MMSSPKANSKEIALTTMSTPTAPIHEENPLYHNNRSKLEENSKVIRAMLAIMLTMGTNNALSNIFTHLIRSSQMESFKEIQHMRKIIFTVLSKDKIQYIHILL